MSKTYFITRHGETFATFKKTGYGLKIRSAHIIQVGKPTLERMAEFLKDIPTDYNTSSQYIRCRETSQIITDHTGKKFVFDRRLNEFFFETFGHLRSRLKNFLAEMENSEYETILICTHGANIAGLIKLLTTGEYHAADLTAFPPPGVLTKIVDGKIVETWDFNLHTPE